MRLGSPREPVWLELPPDQRWLTDVHAQDAIPGYHRRREQALARALSRLRAERPGDDPVELEMDAQAEADRVAVAWLAARTVREWQGVELDDGTPAPCVRERVIQAVCETPNGAALFWSGFVGALALWSVEKKGSGTSPPGTGTAASGAGAARASAEPGANAARSRSGDRAAKRVKRSGPSSAPATASSSAPNGTAG